MHLPISYCIILTKSVLHRFRYSTDFSDCLFRCTPKTFGCGKDKKLRNETFIVPTHSMERFLKSCSMFPVQKTGLRHSRAFRSETESVVKHIVLHIGKAGILTLFSVGNANQIGKRQPGWVHFNVHSIPP